MPYVLQSLQGFLSSLLLLPDSRLSVQMPVRLSSLCTMGTADQVVSLRRAAHRRSLCTRAFLKKWRQPLPRSHPLAGAPHHCPPPQRHRAPSRLPQAMVEITPRKLPVHVRAPSGACSACCTCTSWRTPQARSLTWRRTWTASCWMSRHHRRQSVLRVCRPSDGMCDHLFPGTRSAATSPLQPFPCRPLHCATTHETAGPTSAICTAFPCACRIIYVCTGWHVEG